MSHFFPDSDQIERLEQAKAALRSMGALDETFKLTSWGAQLAQIPVDPRLGQLLKESTQRGTSEDIFKLVAILSLGKHAYFYNSFF